MLELLRKKKSLRILIVAGAAIAALAGAVYLYFHNPHSYPLPCVFYSLTGFYCPGCGAGRASYSLLHGRFLDAFCYNPVMTVLLPLLALYVAARAIDRAITGGDHIDQKISVKFVAGILIFVLLFGIVRNIPVYPFNLLVPGGLFELLNLRLTGRPENKRRKKLLCKPDKAEERKINEK